MWHDAHVRPPEEIKNNMASTTTPLNPNLESILRENRVFPPPPEFAAKARVKTLEEYEELYQAIHRRPRSLLGRHRNELHWFAPWTRVLDWDLPWAKWFVGGKINLCYNCVDRHALGDKARQSRDPLGRRAGRSPQAHLRELHVEVQKFANVLKASA